MAVRTNFSPTQNLKVIIGTEATVGSGTLHGSGTWYQLPMIAPPTIQSNQVALDVGSQQTGLYTPNHNQMKQRLDNPMWEIQLQFLGTANGYPFGVGRLFHNSSTQTLECDAVPEDWTHGATNTYAKHPSATIYIGGGTLHPDGRDKRFDGCICKSVEISHSIDSNAGFPVVTATFITGYLAVANDLVSLETLGGGSAGSPAWTDASGYAPAHFTALTSLVGKHQGETAGSSNFDVRAFGYNLSISRDIQRVGYVSGSNYRPISYEMVGGFSITGDVTFKSDGATVSAEDREDYFRNNQIGGFKFSGTGYSVILSGIVSDVSVDTGSPELRNTISFQGAGNPKTTQAIELQSDEGGGQVVMKSMNHGLSAGQKVTISGTFNYNGTYEIDAPTSLSSLHYFTITHSWDGDDNQGVWTLHADSTAIVSIDL